jgi:hypothetical protein
MPGLALDTVKGRVDKLGTSMRVTVALQNEISEVFKTDEK